MKHTILTILLLGVCRVAYCQKNITVKGSRVAIVIGNDSYTGAFDDLGRVCRNDADSMTDVLRLSGFTVYEYKNLSSTGMKNAFDNFYINSMYTDVALVYYSGHGVALGNHNYMIPVDIKMPGAKEWNSFARNKFRTDAIDINKYVYKHFNTRQDKANFVIIDICRSDLDLAYSDVKSINLNRTKAPPDFTDPDGAIEVQHGGTCVVFATGEMKTSSANSLNGRNSMFTESLLSFIKEPLSYSEVFRKTCWKVRQQSGQQPQPIDQYNGEFVFYDKQLPPTYPIEMVFVQGGKFNMGSNDADARSDEKPVHSVTLNSFSIGKYEVTQRQWKEIMGTNPEIDKQCDDCAVHWVSWDDVQGYLIKLNTKYPGHFYRLPTEAEWEYAARGGQLSRGYKYSGSNKVQEVAYFTDDIHSVYSNIKLSNELGIYGMSGNRSEYCNDWYGASYYSNSPADNPTGPLTGNSRVMRGGAWFSYEYECRSSARFSVLTSNCFYGGFRVVNP